MSANVEPLKVAHFRFALIAPVIQGLYPDASEAAYYRRVTQEPIIRPDGTPYKYSPDTLEKVQKVMAIGHGLFKTPAKEGALKKR